MCSIETTPVVRTERLRLRRLRKTDAKRLAALANDQAVLRMTSRMPNPYGIGEAEAFLDHVETQDPQSDRTFAIDHQDEGLIGVLGFSPGHPGGSEIGYWIGRDYWGRGYATEAAAGALDWARTGWRRRLVTAAHFADNPASGEVLCKVGFLYTGEVKQIYSRARGEDATARGMVWLA